MKTWLIAPVAGVLAFTLAPDVTHAVSVPHIDGGSAIQSIRFGGGGFGGHFGGGHAFRGFGGFGGGHAFRGFGGFRGGMHFRGGPFAFRPFHRTVFFRPFHRRVFFRPFHRRVFFRPFHRNVFFFAGPSYYSYYYYSGCGWLRRRAFYTGAPYWWNRYYNCIGYYYY